MDLHTDIELERSCLGALLVAPELMAEASAKLKPEVFGVVRHRKIFAAMLRLFQQSLPIDPVTIQHELYKNDEIEATGGLAYLLDCLNGAVRPQHLSTYCEALQELFKKRQLLKSANFLWQAVQDRSLSSAEVIGSLRGKLDSIAMTDDHMPRALADLAYDHVQKLQDGVYRNGLLVNLKTLDLLTGGFKAGEVTVLAARPSVGKTALALQIALEVAQNAGVLFISLEMALPQVLTRIVCALSGIPASRLKSGWLNQAERAALGKALRETEMRRLFITERSGLTIEQIAGMARYYKRTTDLGLLVVDYLQLIRPAERKATREQEVADISHRLKEIAKSLEIPVLALAQLNRASEARAKTGNPRPSLGDLRESGAIEADADVIAFMARTQPEDNTEIRLYIAKNRDGEIGECAMRFSPATFTFQEID